MFCFNYSELPTCVPVQCGLPESPENGKAHYTALAYKSVVTYTCKYGFMVVGDGTRYGFIKNINDQFIQGV